MKRHKLKIWPSHFNAVVDGRKKAEFRLNDRGFEEGDELQLQEYDPESKTYTGLDALVRVTHIFRIDVMVTEKRFRDYVMMSIERVM